MKEIVSREYMLRFTKQVNKSISLNWNILFVKKQDRVHRALLDIITWNPVIQLYIALLLGYCYEVTDEVTETIRLSLQKEHIKLHRQM